MKQSPITKQSRGRSRGPAERRKPGGRPARRVPERRLARAKHLVLADANRLFVDALAMAMTDRDYEIAATAVTCPALLRAVLVHRPDACLLDLWLSDGSAVDVIDRIHARLPRVKIVVLSARTDPASLAAALAAGAVGCLSKGRKGIDVLDHALQRLMFGEFPMDPAPAEEAVARAVRAPEELPMRWLTIRELEVLRRLAGGESTQQIAQVLGVTVNTARTHVQNVLDKLGVHSRLEAVAVANRAHLTDRW